MTRRVGLVRGTGATTAVLLMLLAGCGRPPADGTSAPSATTAPSDSAGPAQTGEPASASTPSTGIPVGPDEDASFSFDDVASYPGGDEVEVAGAVARRAAPGTTGAEATRGELVVVSVLLRNLSAADLDASTVLVTAAYGPDDREAPLVTDPTGALTGGFLGALTPGAENTADLGFAIPFAAAGRVRVTVDLGDGVHEPVSFVGAVERDQ